MATRPIAILRAVVCIIHSLLSLSLIQHPTNQSNASPTDLCLFNDNCLSTSSATTPRYVCIIWKIKMPILPCVHTEYVLRTLQGYKIPFTAFDLASDEDAKKTWRRRAPPSKPLPWDQTCAFIKSNNYSAKQQLPGILVGGEYPGVCGHRLTLKISHYLSVLRRVVSLEHPTHIASAGTQLLSAKQQRKTTNFTYFFDKKRRTGEMMKF